MDDWRIAAELALRLGADFDFATVDDVHRRDRPRRARVRGRRRRAAAPGARRRGAPDRRAPRRDRAAAPRELTILADDGSGASWDPIKVEGEAVDRRRRPPTPRPRPRADDDADAATPKPSPRPRPRRARRSTTGTARSRTPRCPRATRTLCASWSVRTLYDAGRMVASSAVARRARRRPSRCVVHPHDLGRIGVEPSGDDVRVTSARGTRRARRCAPTPAVAPGIARSSPFAPSGAGARRRSSTSTRVGHRPARGDARGDRRRARARAPIRCSSDGVDLTVVLIVIGKTIAVFVLLLCR